MRRSYVAGLAVVAVVIACNVTDSTVGPKQKNLSVQPTVVPPTNNSACTMHWATGVNGSWFDASKWNPAGIPGSTSSVCIDAPGTYTVQLDPVVDSIPVPLLALSLGGAGTSPILEIGSNGGRFNVSEGVAISSGATLWFSGTGSTLTAGGTITNNGSLKVSAPCGGCGGATISADLINSGTLQILGGPKLTLSKVNGQYQNTGNMTFGGTIDIPATAGNVLFSQEGGLYSGAGSFDAFTMRSGVFQLKSGKLRPRFNLLPMVVLDGANLVIDSTATDSATIGVRGRTDGVPTITGNVPALTTLWIGGASNGGTGQVALAGNPFNYGTMRVTRTMDASGGIIVTGAGRLTNVGTINNTDANRDTLFYSIDLTNTGTINAIGQSSITLQKMGGSYENSGLIDLQAGISTLTIRSNATFTNTSPGSITNGGIVVDENSHLRGTGTLNSVVVPQNGGAIDPGTSPGLFTFRQFRMPSTGLLNIELGGLTPATEYDRLVVTELAGFGGTLNIAEINGFQSGLCGQVFDIAYAPSAAAGMFPVINGLNPAPGRMLRAIMVGQTTTTPAIVRLVGFDPNVKVCAGPPSISLSEGGPTLQYAVALRDAPTSTVIVKAVGDAQVSAPDSAVFTTSNWQTPQILHVTAIDDTVYEGTHSGVVTHTVRSLDAAYNGTAAGSITATVTDNDVPPSVPTTVTVTIDSSSVEVGHTAHASAVVRDQNGNVMAGETVVWSSNTPSFASVSSGGVVTGIGAGTAVIKATDGSAFGTASITVTAAPPPPPVVTSISVSIDSTSLQEGHTAQASATVRDQYGAVMSGQTITWSTDTPLRVSVSIAGVVTAISAGSASIRATVGSVSNTASLTITAPPPPPPVVTTVSVSIDSSSLQVGHTAQAAAVVRDQYGAVMSGQTIAWSSDTPLFATVSNAGVVTAVAEGTASIRATVGAVSNTASLAVTTPPPGPVVTTITVSIDSTFLEVGHTAQAMATVRDQYGAVMTGQTVVWTALEPLFVSVSSSGVVTGLSATLVTSIRANVGAVSGSASITIYELPRPTTVSVTVDSSSLQVGHTAQASAVVKDQNGAVMSGEPITWSTNTPSIVSVSSTGVVTGLTAGTADIRAAAGSAVGTAALAIGSAPPASPVPFIISIVVDSASGLHVGNTSSARAIVYDQYYHEIPNLPVTWSTVTRSIVSISSSGLVTGLKAGYGLVQASYGDATDVRGVRVVEFDPPAPRRIEVSLSPMSVGDNTTATATVYDQYGAVMPSQPVTWQIETPATLAISNTSCTGPSACRSISALATGWGRISATLGKLSAKGQIYVSSGYDHAFVGFVSQSQAYSLFFFTGCAWRIWLENIQMTSDWRNNGEGSVSLTVKQDTGDSSACHQALWTANLRFMFPSLLKEGFETDLQTEWPQWYRAKFRVTKVSKTGMSGVLTILFSDFPSGRSFQISQNMTLK